MGLCDDGDFDDSMAAQLDYGWVVVVKLEYPQLDPDPCMSIYNKVRTEHSSCPTLFVFISPFIHVYMFIYTRKGRKKSFCVALMVKKLKGIVGIFYIVPNACPPSSKA